MISAFFATPIGYVVYLVLATTLVAFLSGVAAALRDGSFSWQAIDAFIRAYLMGRVMPIFVLLLGGYLVTDAAGAALTASGLAAATAYVTSTVAAVLANWTQAQTQGVPSE